MGALRWLVPFGMLLLISCQTTSSQFCDIAKPIRPSAAQVDQMTDEQVRQLLSHNEKGGKLCGWRP